MVFGHNFLDGVRFAPDTAAHYLWSILHQKNVLPLGGGFAVPTTYPLIPLVGVMALGYCLGAVYELRAVERQRILLRLGGATFALFLLLRVFKLYGEANQFAVQPSVTLTLMSFFIAIFSWVRPVEQDAILFRLGRNKMPSCSTISDGRTHMQTAIT